MRTQSVSGRPLPVVMRYASSSRRGHSMLLPFTTSSLWIVLFPILTCLSYSFEDGRLHGMLFTPTKEGSCIGIRISANPLMRRVLSKASTAFKCVPGVITGIIARTSSGGSKFSLTQQNPVITALPFSVSIATA